MIQRDELVSPQQIMAFSEPISKLRDVLTHADRSPEDPQEVLASNKGNAKTGGKKQNTFYLPNRLFHL